MRKLWALLHRHLCKCPDCGHYDMWAMTDGSWICHNCGEVK